MFRDDDSIFDIVHSIPVITHSVALAMRTPTAGYAQKPKYLPDYGGVLETPCSALKNGTLAKGLPFNPQSTFERISMEKQDLTDSSHLVKAQDCLAVLVNLGSEEESQLAIVRALDKALFFDTITMNLEELENSQHYRAQLHCIVPFANRITGIKYSESLQDLLQVKFDKGVKIMKLLNSFPVQLSPDIGNLSDIQSGPESLRVSQPLDNHPEGCPVDSPYEFLATIPERRGFQVKDMCLNSFNRSIQALASDNFDTQQVKLYDLTSSLRHPFQIISWNSSNNVSTSPSPEFINLRGRLVRQFIPTRPAIQGIQQMDNIPSHIVNMLITTGYQIAILDPRSNKPGQICADKSNIPSFYPIEFLRRTEFSTMNNYQFYSLSNVHIRAFDTRFPGVPLNQVNHMLDTDTSNPMSMKLYSHQQSNLETLCSSSHGDLCFSTFDQTQRWKLANPRSCHLPWHELRHEDCTHEGNQETYGLSMIVNKGEADGIFSILQLLSNGDVCLRRYNPCRADSDMNLDFATQAEYILQQERSFNVLLRARRIPGGESDLDDRDILDPDINCDDAGFINLLDHEPLVYMEDRLASKRALERFEKMKLKLYE